MSLSGPPDRGQTAGHRTWAVSSGQGRTMKYQVKRHFDAKWQLAISCVPFPRL